MTTAPFSNPVALDFVDRLRASARGNRIAWGPELTPFIRECGAMSGVVAADTAVALFRSAGEIVANLTATHGPPPWDIHPYDFAPHAAAVSDFGALLLKRKNPSLTVGHIRELLDQSVRFGDVSDWFTPHIQALFAVVRSRWPELSDCPDVRANLTQLAVFARRLERKPRAFRYSAGKSGDFAVGVERLLDPLNAFPIDPGEGWTDAVLADLQEMPASERLPWLDLLHLCRDAPGSAPGAKWTRDIARLLDVIGLPRAQDRLLRWLPLFALPRTDDWPYVNPEYNRHFRFEVWPHHADVLRGLCWIAGLHRHDDLARALRDVVLAGYRKRPGRERCVKAGNAGVLALGLMPGPVALAHLAALRARVKFVTGQRMIAKALAAVAEREGVPPDEIEEIAAPTLGMCEVGRLERTLEGCAAALRIDGDSIAGATIQWTDASGKRLKAAPAAVKAQRPEELKELSDALQDMRKLLPAQRDRIENLILEPRSWVVPIWRERYLDHPLVGIVARRLIWLFDEGSSVTAAAWLREDPKAPPHSHGALVRADGSAFDPAPHARVSLWFPLDAGEGGRPRADIAEWRAFYEAHRIRQPFKQAHREIYPLSEHERGDAVYSNRFAGRVLRQRIYRGLAHERRWRDPLRHMNDGCFPPTHRLLPHWGIRAEFWVQGDGDEVDGAGYRNLSTDQVRFYHIDALREGAASDVLLRGSHKADAPQNQPIRLQDVPNIVLSEVFRDIDLMVSVSDLGASLDWQDGGVRDRHKHYWSLYVVGPLGPSGKERLEILQALMPRLRIAPACTITDPFLVVLGKRRAYKIHIGSGKTLMPPSDRLLNIGSPRRGPSKRDQDSLFLPFEGDHTLSVILSKAILLADDDKITDPDILRQIDAP